MSLNLSLSFKFNGVNTKDAKPTVNIANLEGIKFMIFRNRSVEKTNHRRKLSLSPGNCRQVEAFSF
jgi:hypothetical protein